MQQTEKYKLNLIETSDTFSPDALNENMEKVETAITAEADALGQRLQVFEAKHVVIGSYRPTTNLDIDLGFWPVCVIIMMLGTGNYGYGMLFRESTHTYAKITPNGFHIDASGYSPISNGNFTYGYVAFD